jgi:DNA-directed RNA polymerase subunit RPC12/RpoP
MQVRFFPTMCFSRRVRLALAFHTSAMLDPVAIRRTLSAAFRVYAFEMQVRVNAGFNVSQLKEAVSLPKVSGIWHKFVSLATPQHRDRCPKCGSRDFLRSHRKNAIEFAISSFALPYRCSHCYFRFFRGNEQPAADPRRYREHYPSLQHAPRT